MQLVRECMAAECAMLSAQLILQRYIWRRKQHLLRAVEVLKRLVSVTFVSSTQFLLLHACSLVTLSFAPPLHKRKSVFFLPDSNFFSSFFFFFSNLVSLIKILSSLALSAKGVHDPRQTQRLHARTFRRTHSEKGHGLGQRHHTPQHRSV